MVHLLVPGQTSLTILPVTPSVTISGNPVLVGTVGDAYAGFTVTGAYGSIPYVYSVYAGTLPDGITMDASTGVVAGTPTTAGTQTGIVLRVTDNDGATADLASFDLAIGANAATITPDPPPPGTISTPWSGFTVTASRGTAPYTYSLFHGTLPNGVTLNSTTGVVAGTPTESGTFHVIVKAIDANGHKAYTKSVTFTISL